MKMVLGTIAWIVLGTAALLATAAEKPAGAKAGKAGPSKVPAAAPAASPAPSARKAELRPRKSVSASKKGENKPVAKIVPAIADSDNTCMLCHGESDVWDKDRRRLFVTVDKLAGDIHWQKGLRCQDCHGGDPTSSDFAAAHSKDKGFRSIKAADIPEFCGKCHANIEFMRRFQPSPRTDQLAEYWTSGHGRRLKTGDTAVATCISCHDWPHGNGQDKAKHGIRPVGDLDSPVYRTNVAKTCAKCHSDEKLMAGRTYHGRPISHDQYENWSKSIHAKTLLEKGDLSAPTCNNCHGNHGAVPPQVDSVANACGTCHVKNAQLFADARMKHRFEEVGLPGCATCHGNHLISPPTDEMVGMGDGAVCMACHANGKYGATLAGARAARTMRAGLENLKREINEAQEKIAAADRLGMEVRGPRFDLRKAADALTNARVLIHSFSMPPIQKVLDEGGKAATQVDARAQAALEEHDARRVWLAFSLVPIAIVIVLLLLYIRSTPVRG